MESIERRARAVNSLICVGLDPRVGEGGVTDAASALAACQRIVTETQHLAASYKPNSAFFESLPGGQEALKELIASVPPEIPVILDCKRGDIFETAEAYAKWAADLGAKIVTLSGYMGTDSLMPFLNRGMSCFVLCKTSNGSSDQLQSLRVTGADGGERFLFEEVARQMHERFAETHNVGLVVGATDPKVRATSSFLPSQSMALARKQAPSLWILCPGVGKQGGDLEQSYAAGRRASDGLGLLINSSRGIAQAASPREAISELHTQLKHAIASPPSPSSSNPAPSLSPSSSCALAPYQVEFIEFCMRYKILSFGQFKLKSGRLSPYFFDAGKFSDGAALEMVGRQYADVLLAHPEVDFNLLYGPAYKGIPLACTTAVALSRRKRVFPVAFNRKEAKLNEMDALSGKLKEDFEKGLLMGSPVRGARAVLIDDVVTAGTAVKETLELFSRTGTTLAAVLILIDREEVMAPASGEESALPESARQRIAREYGIPVLSIIGMTDIINYLGSMPGMETHLREIQEYRSQYGARRD